MKKFVNTLSIIFCFIFFESFKAQNSIKYLEIEWENGSEAAKKIMKSNFYYDPLDSWSPFGNDIGNDTYYLYCDWKREHPNENIKKFMEEELVSSGYSGFDVYLDGKDTEKLKKIVDTMLNKYIDLNAINNMVISLAFTQLFLEGHIEPEVKKWAEAAFSREMVYLDFWNGKDGEMEERKVRINQLLDDLRKG